MKFARLVPIALLATLASAAPALAQGAPAAVDQAKLSAARRIVEGFFPESSRGQIINAMMDAISKNMRDGLASSGTIRELMEANAAARPVFERFLDRQLAVEKRELTSTMPELMDAMAAAYARRFSAAQLNELATFFATPTGQAYVRESMTILSDPDIARVQSQMMARSMARMPEAVATLIEELKSAPPPIPGT